MNTTNNELDPFACAELLARPRVAAPVRPEPTGAWVRCTSCTDPGFDHDEFKWPEPAPAVSAQGSTPRTLL